MSSESEHDDLDEVDDCAASVSIPFSVSLLHRDEGVKNDVIVFESGGVGFISYNYNRVKCSRNFVFFHSFRK